uniref:Uncharacterized protein n=1 Tax=Strongyloides papillosus TaxID=174720 RepID=A0A0N5C2G6_STREA
MSSFENYSNETIQNNNTKKVYPKERWPRDLIHSESESDGDGSNYHVEAIIPPNLTLQNQSYGNVPNSILKNDSSVNKNNDENNDKSKSVVFDLNRVPSENNAISYKGNGKASKSFAPEDNNENKGKQ